MGAEKFSLHVTRFFLHLALCVKICVKFWYIAKERPFNLISHTQPVSPHTYMHNVVWSLRNIKWNLGLWGNLAPARIFWILDSWKCHLKWKVFKSFTTSYSLIKFGILIGKSRVSEIFFTIFRQLVIPQNPVKYIFWKRNLSP